MSALFTIDLEDWNDGLHIPKNGHSSLDAALYLHSQLAFYHIKAVVYILGKFRQEVMEHDIADIFSEGGHMILSHGYYHYRYEESDRQPYANLGMTGGFWFRFLPYQMIKKNILDSGHFYIHPHDLDEKHPRLSNPLMDFKRHVGLKTARAKLEKLMQEIQWDKPRRY